MRISHAAPALCITALGISSVITQITVIRELLSTYDGAELIIGIVLCSWLLLTGIGALAGQHVRNAPRLFAAALPVIAFLPFAHIVVLRLFRFHLAVPGAAVDAGLLLVLIPATILPYCVLSGLLLTAATTLFSQQSDPAGVGRVYFLDSIGDILGGVLFTFLLVAVTDTFGALYLPAILVLAGAVVFALSRGRRVQAWGAGALLLTLPLLYVADVNITTLRRLFPGHREVEIRESPYGRIALTRTAGQVTVYENGIPTASGESAMEAEETIHPVLAQTSGRDLTVLLISGAIKGTLREVLKYPVRRVEYVELDPEMVDIAKRECPELEDPRVTIHATDGRRFIERTAGRYDAVVVDVPPPENLQLNRFYTAEFLESVKKILKPGGVVSFSLPGAANYINDDLVRLYQSGAATARAVFGRVAAFPLGSTIFVLSDHAIDRDVGARVARCGVNTEYVHSAYLDGVMTADRMARIEEIITQGGVINRDLSPTAFLLEQRYWLSRYRLNPWIVIGVLVASGLLFLMLTGGVEAALATTGFVSIGMEVVILLLFQVHAGYLYRSYGLMVTIFMAGIAAGSWGTNALIGRGHGRKLLQWTDIMVAGTALLLLLLCRGDWWRSTGLLQAMIFATAALTGAQFPAAALHRKGSAGRIAARLYLADFVGSGIGALVCTVALVPMLGVVKTLAVFAAIKILSTISLVAGRRE